MMIVVHYLIDKILMKVFSVKLANVHQHKVKLVLKASSFRSI